MMEFATDWYEKKQQESEDCDSGLYPVKRQQIKVDINWTSETIKMKDFSIRLTPLKDIPTTLKRHHSGNTGDDNIVYRDVESVPDSLRMISHDPQSETVTKTCSTKRSRPSCDNDEAITNTPKRSKADKVAVNKRMKCRRSTRLAKKGTTHYEEPVVSDDCEYICELWLKRSWRFGIRVLATGVYC
ncbi:uncharacterized protein [Dysidea avara]|uniref:uncharacterized protein n=1 Tax=Dysidea avara TaxID=196820 RepID=UPI00332E1D14